MQGHSLLTLQMMFSTFRFLLMLIVMLHAHSSFKTVGHTAGKGRLLGITEAGSSLQQEAPEQVQVLA